MESWFENRKITKIKLGFIKDNELLLLLEKSIHGRISSVLGPRYFETDENTKLLYIDANNPYGWAMSQYLPTGNFEKIYFPDNYSQEQVVEDLLQIPDNNTCGYFIEGWYALSSWHQRKTESFPLCPYQTKADPNLFSDYMNSVKQPYYKPTSKLMCDVTNKNNYMMHYRVFKFYTEMGMKVSNKDTLTLAIQTLFLVRKIY